MHEYINPIVCLFPDFEEKIVFLYQTDENFHDLCHDYLWCDQNVLVIKKDDNNNNGQLEEYEDLKLSLQKEINQIIRIQA